MKSRQYYARIADERLDTEEMHSMEYHDSILDLIPACITLWYIILAMIAPSKPLPEYEAMQLPYDSERTIS